MKLYKKIDMSMHDISLWNFSDLALIFVTNYEGISVNL